jgi:fatty acid desaturase
LSTYGTSGDPEYLPFAHSKRMTFVFTLESFLMPAAFMIRFLLLAPAGLLYPPLHRWLARHASALTMNFNYRRDPSLALMRKIRVSSLMMLAIWGVGFALLPRRVFITWFCIVSVISFINTLRTLVAHRYENHGEPLDRRGQLADSLDTPGALWTELWAPVGLRYHALHHYFPGIPYHNLYKAHRILVSGLPGDSAYHASLNDSLPAGLKSLYSGSPTGR